MSRWALTEHWKLANTVDQRNINGDATVDATTRTMSVHLGAAIAATNEGKMGVQPEQESRMQEIKDENNRKRWIISCLARLEALVGDARKVYRLFQFLEMLDMLRHVNESQRIVRILRRLRIVSFFFFYLLENYMVYLLRVEGFPPRHPRLKLLKRSCNGFWCFSILLAFPLDHLLHRGSILSFVKKLLDLPVAYLAFTDQRVSDGIFGALGLTSAQIGVYMRWMEVVKKLREKKLTDSGVIRDLA